MTIALVLAGSRGPDDPVAKTQNMPLKAFVQIHGKAMLDYVVGTLDAHPAISSILIALPEHAQVTQYAPFTAQLVKSGKAKIVAPANSPARSVLKMADMVGEQEDILLSTADHPLLSTAMITDFLDGCGPEASVAFVPLAHVQNAYPQTRRTRLRFQDGAYSGCNLFAFRTKESLELVQFWTRLEHYRKRPLKMASIIGWKTFLMYFLNSLTLADVMDLIGQKTKIAIASVILTQPEAAIDVDKPDDLALVERILE